MNKTDNERENVNVMSEQELPSEGSWSAATVKEVISAIGLALSMVCLIAAIWNIMALMSAVILYMFSERLHMQAVEDRKTELHHDQD